MRGNEIPTCPCCTTPLHRILYGETYTDEESYMDAYSKFVIGGHKWPDDEPIYVCPKCGKRYCPGEARTFLPLIQPIADKFVIEEGYSFAQIYGRYRDDYVFIPHGKCSEHQVSYFPKALFVDSYLLSTLFVGGLELVDDFQNCKKISSRKGQRIFEKVSEKYYDGTLPPNEMAYWKDIIENQMSGYETPIDKHELYTYIDAAERLGKKLKVVPDEGKEDLRDGWRYHVELVDIEVVF